MATAPQTAGLGAKFLAAQRAQLTAEHAVRAAVVETLAAEVSARLGVREAGGGPVEGFGTGETASVELQEARDQLDKAVARLADLDAAFSRMDDGTYGLCERCHQPIGRDRLEAVPTATRCIGCEARRQRPSCGSAEARQPGRPEFW